jgi:two-component system sensor histidine kinase YesM
MPGFGRILNFRRVKLLEELHQITTLYQESEVLLGSESLGSVFSTTEDDDQAITVQQQSG